MNRKIIAVALLGAVALVALPSQAETMTLKSVTVTLKTLPSATPTF